MRLLLMLLLALISLPCVVSAQDYVLDSNTAFFEGEVFNYVVPPPPGFRMVTKQANDDGFSLAFVPPDETYDSASVIIAISMLKLGEFSVEDALASDTISARGHFGEGLEISQIDSLHGFGSERLKTLFFDSPDDFVPLTLMSYFDGVSDLVVYELYLRSITLPRFEAIELFTSCVGRFRALPRAEQEGSDR